MNLGKPLSAQTQSKTRVLPIDASNIGQFVFSNPQQRFLGDWELNLSHNSPHASSLQEAASRLRKSDIPVAFPTETVYGLGADATRGPAVQGIYTAKQRPSDNPLIVHISSMTQLRKLLASKCDSKSAQIPPQDPIPLIYHTLISKFWPGPLTILLPLPKPSPFASEVTACLPTVAVRMPSSRLALALIQLAGIPIAAPSANSSSKPSPTTAAHVLHDLAGRIDLILDGGPCTIGVESTVVDGLSNPPVILRPGGVSLDMLKGCPGWEDVRIAYKDGAETGVPRAPGMKYKHYSPAARVLLFRGLLNGIGVRSYLDQDMSIGILRTKTWRQDTLWQGPQHAEKSIENGHALNSSEKRSLVRNIVNSKPEIVEAIDLPTSMPVPSAQHSQIHLDRKHEQSMTDVWDIGLGPDTADIARGLFSALRELDQKGVSVIFVEGIDDNEGDAAAAVMNRLRKAAEAEIIL
ncbi:L-threonylcarbamoyladenylate synthase, partial [Lecanoromycetidae sp. Uapishka_2]